VWEINKIKKVNEKNDGKKKQKKGGRKRVEKVKTLNKRKDD
jgi:hypothetical protein